MGLMTKRGSLPDLAARLERARADLAGVEARLVDAANERAEAVGRLGEEDLDPVALVKRLDEISAPERDLLKQREALTEQVESLGKRCAALAASEAEAKVEALRGRLAPFARERDEIDARLVAIAAEEAEIEAEISEALDAVRWAAAEFDSTAKAAAEALRVQERERVRWLAAHATPSRLASELEGESPRFRRLVDEEIARLASGEDAQRARRRAESEESLRAVGLDPSDVRESRGYVRLR